MACCANKIEELLKTLTYREREIIRLRYGLGDGYTYTLEEVGRIFKVTRERVRQIEAKAVAQAATPGAQPHLEPFVPGVADRRSRVMGSQCKLPARHCRVICAQTAGGILNVRKPVWPRGQRLWISECHRVTTLRPAAFARQSMRDDRSLNQSGTLTIHFGRIAIAPRSPRMSITAAALRELHRIHQQLAELRDRLERGPKQVRAAKPTSPSSKHA